MNRTLLKLQIGPVQDFIAQARSTRDLWSGSYLLSWLLAAGLRKLTSGLASFGLPSSEAEQIRDLPVPDWTAPV
jgi:CRISPR-associated protein Cmr2